MIMNFINSVGNQTLARILAFLLLIFLPVFVVAGLAFGLVMYAKEIVTDAVRLVTVEVPIVCRNLFKIIKNGNRKRG